MKDLAIHLRYLQLVAHNAHNEVAGPTFFANHEFLGELYPAYETAYDAVVERIIGLGKPVDLCQVQVDAAAKLPKMPSPLIAKEAFDLLLHGETVLCRHIERLAKGEISQGTLNLLAGLANESEQRQYKIGQRRA